MNTASRVLAFLSLVPATATFSQAQAFVKPGSPAPAVPVERWLQSPAGFDGGLAGLRGKVVVLEFWATWCTPCVAQIPHLNQLADAYADRGVVFLSITDDDEERLKAFLAERPMSAAIGIDTTRKNWKTYGVPSIPFTVLIGKDGNVIGSTRPESVTGSVLDEALAGRSPRLPSVVGVESDLEWDRLIEWQDGVAPSAYAIIKPIVTTTSGYLPQADHFVGDGLSLQALVQGAFRIDSFHLDWRVPKTADEQFYRVAARVPKNHAERLYPLLQQTVVSYFGLKSHWEEPDREVFALRRVAHSPPFPASKADEPLIQMLRGKIKLRRQRVSRLCDLIANSLHKIVVDETGLRALYDFDLSYQPGRPEVTTTDLNRLGFEVANARRKVRILVVEQTP